jgi:biopolymer transport protein ExbD
MKLPRHLATLRGPLNIAPMISVVLLLLIFFMLSSSFIIQPGFRVELPHSNYGQSVQADNLIVSILMPPERKDPTTGQPIKGDPFLFFNDQVIKLSDLDKRLHDLAKDRPPQTLVIKADKEAPHGLVVDIMNLAMGLNWSVVLATQRGEGKSDDLGP